MTDTAPTAIPPSSQVTLPDGRVELAPGSPPPSGPYANEDLLPVRGGLAVGGADFHPLVDGRPVPLLEPLADYGWAVGLGTSLLLYLALTLLPATRPGTVQESPTARP
ncbi:hypothetical protein [Streptomyces sp. NPDC003730]